MKKCYYLDFNFEYATETEAEKELQEFFVARWGQFGFFKTRKEAKTNMLKLYYKIKASDLWWRLRESKCKNTITIDLFKVVLPIGFDISVDTIWSCEDRYLVDSRYVIGRY